MAGDQSNRRFVSVDAHEARREKAKGGLPQRRTDQIRYVIDKPGNWAIDMADVRVVSRRAYLLDFLQVTYFSSPMPSTLVPVWNS